MNKKKKIILITILVLLLLLVTAFLLIFAFGTKAKNIGAVKKLLKSPDNYKLYYQKNGALEEDIQEVEDKTRDAILNELKDMKVHLSYTYIFGSGYGWLTSGHILIFEDKTTGEKVKIGMFPKDLSIEGTQYEYINEDVFDRVDSILRSSNLAKEGVFDSVSKDSTLE